MAKSLDDIYSLLEGMDDNLKNVAKSRVSSKEKGEDKDGDNNKRTEVWDRAAHSIVMWLFDQIKVSFESWQKFEKEAYDVGRAIGLNGEALKQFDDIHRKSVRDISYRYGLLGKDLAAIQEGYGKATGKARVLTSAQLDFTAAMTRLTDPETVQSMINNMDIMGSSVDTANARLAKMQNTAKKWGLHAGESAKVIAKNVGLASSYHFKGGTDELSKMVLKSQTLRMNFEAIAKTSEKFTSIESAISTAANIQMLGGTFAQAFANPLEVMYEATSDQAAYMERIFSTLEGKGTYNKETGEVEFAPITRQFMRSYAQQLGMSLEELIKGASSKIQHAEIEKAVAGKGFTDEQIAWIKNQATFNTETKQWEVTDLDTKGNVVGSTAIIDLTFNKIKNLQANTVSEEQSFKDIKSIKEYVAKLAQDSTSFSDKFSGAKEAWSSFIAEGPNQLGDVAHGVIDNMGKWLAPTGIAIGGAWALGREWLSGKVLSPTPSAKGNINTKTPNANNTQNTKPSKVKKGGLSRSVKRAGIKAGGKIGGKLATGAVTGLKGGTPLALGGLAVSMTNDYLVNKGIIDDGSNTNKTLDTLGRTASWAGTGAMIGGIVGSVVPIIGNATGAVIGGALGGVAGAAKGIWDNWVNKSEENKIEDPQLVQNQINEGNTGLLATAAQATVGIEDAVNSIRTKMGESHTTVVSQPVVGRSEYISRVSYTTEMYRPTPISDTINLNITGTLRINGDKNSADLDMRKLLENVDFKRQIVDIVQQGMNAKANNGRGQLLDAPSSIRGGAASKNDMYMV